MVTDIQNKLQRRHDRRRALLITAISMVVVYILWNVPSLEFIVYPLKLFVTYVHEAGHSLAAIITGGEVQHFLVSPNGSGLAVTRGGTQAAIIPAGYLGAAFFGSALFYIVNRFPRFTRLMSVALGLFMVAFTLLFARPDETGSPIAIVIGLSFGGVLAFMGLKLNHVLNHLVLNILAVMTALNAVLDVFFLIANADAGRGNISNDAAAFAREVTPLLPASVVATIWAGFAILMLGIAVWFGVYKPIREELDDAISALE